jgi:alpha-L-fucosidase 2
MKFIRFFIALTFLSEITLSSFAMPITPRYNLNFPQLASSWDEGIPLGNAMLGALIWQKEDHLRISLDRADLWDLRPMENFTKPEYSFKWVQQQVKDNNYQIV